MNILITFLFLAVSLEVPDSVFEPANALRIKAPQWQFPIIKERTDFIKAGYFPIFEFRLSTFWLKALKGYDYTFYYAMNNKYFFSTKYFTLSHNLNALWRSRKNTFLVVQDTLDFYFSYGRVIPNITLLPAYLYVINDTIENKVKYLNGSFSLTYSNPDGILFYLSSQSFNLLKSTKRNDILGGGIGLMNPRKFVAIGLYSNLVPEIAIRALLPGGTYLDLYYGYSARRLYPFRYLYPTYSIIDTLFCVAGKDFNLLLERSPYMLRVDYFVPDSVYSRSLYAKFTFEKKMGGFSYEYYKNLGSGIIILSHPVSNDTDVQYLRLFPRPISKGKAFVRIPLSGKIVIIPEVNMIKDMWSGNTVYAFSPGLKYQSGNIEVFLEGIGLYNYGKIKGIQPQSGSLVEFFNKRRFRIGAKYSF